MDQPSRTLPPPILDETTYSSRAEYVYETIRSEIHAGRLGPGQRVREVDLAEWLNVSRTPIREAIRRLIENGLLSHNSLGGLAITSLNMAEVSELYALRGILEGAAAAFSAQHALEPDIERMYELARACADATSPAAAAKLNNHLHEAIHGASHNRYLIELQKRFGDWLTLLPGTTFEAEGRGQRALEEHRAIIDAIGARDADSAFRLARTHIENAYKVRLTQMFPS